MITKQGVFKQKTKAWDHQSKEFEISKDLEYRALFWEMGTGKTKTIIDTITYLYLKGEIDGALILSDNGCCNSWLDQVDIHIPDNVDYRIERFSSQLHGDALKKIEALMEAQNDVLDLLIMNVEGMSHERPFRYAYKFLASHYPMMVVDESTSIKSPTSLRTKNCIKLGRFADYRRIMTGTPTTQGPLDLYSMCEFLKPELLGHRTFTTFRSMYAITMDLPTGGRFPAKVVVGYQNLDFLSNKLLAFSSRVMKKDCLDLPPKTYEVIEVELSDEQKRTYDSITQMALFQHELGLLTVTSALTAINKLLQVCCGHVKLDEGDIVRLVNNRLKSLEELLDKLTTEKVVIWCAFQEDVRMVMEMLSQRKDGKAVAYYGPVSQVDRDKALHQFHSDDNCKWFVGTAAAGGKGINKLVGARYSIYYSNTYSLEDRLQSEDRIHRPGQTRSVTYFDLVCPGTVDAKVMKALRNKHSIAEEVLQAFKSLVRPG